MKIKNATYGLGIDTGGTYTDAAIVDMATRKVVAKAKSPTTHYDLTIGLGGAVDNVLAATHSSSGRNCHGGGLHHVGH